MHPRGPRTRTPERVDASTSLKKLHQAIRHMTADDCRLWLDAGADVNAVYRRKTALGLALEEGQLEVCRDILARPQLRVDARDSEECSPLWHAASLGKTEVAQALIDKGACVNAPDRGGRTPLHAACFHDNSDVARSLLGSGAEVDRVDGNGVTPLNFAASTLAVGVTQILLSHGADANTRLADTRPLMTVLRNNASQHVTFRARKLELLRALISSGAHVDVRDRSGDGGHVCTCLHYAVVTGQLGAACLLMSSGCGVDIPDNRQLRPLHDALLKDDFEMAKYILVFGADANVPSRWLASAGNRSGLPLFYALLTKRRTAHRLSKTKLLPYIVRAADFGRGKGEEVIARIAGSSGATDKVKGLAVGAVRTIADRELFYSALRVVRDRLRQRRRPRVDMLGAIDSLPVPFAVKTALALGLDLQKQHPWNACQLHSAVALGDQDRFRQVARTRVSMDVSLRQSTPLMTAIRNSRREDRSRAENLRATLAMLELLLDRGADVNAASENGSVPLHSAAVAGQRVVLDWLVQRGADLQARTSEGRTPLELAARAGCFQLVLALIAHGADVRQTPSCGIPILHVAAAAGSQGVVQRLLDSGVDANTLDTFGNTAVHVAASRGQLYLNIHNPPACVRKLNIWGRSHHVDVIRVLLERGCDVNARNNDDRTAHEIAMEFFNCQDDLAKMLKASEKASEHTTQSSTTANN